jgi:hypothetical protein
MASCQNIDDRLCIIIIITVIIIIIITTNVIIIVIGAVVRIYVKEHETLHGWSHIRCYKMKISEYIPDNNLLGSVQNTSNALDQLLEMSE